MKQELFISTLRHEGPKLVFSPYIRTDIEVIDKALVTNRTVGNDLQKPCGTA